MAGAGGTGDVGLRHHLRGSLRGLLRRRAAGGRHARARRGDDLQLRPRDHARRGRGRASRRSSRSRGTRPARPAGARASEPGTQPETCGTCRGQGQVRFSQGFLTVARPCPTCRGPGHDQPAPAARLRGPGTPGAASGCSRSTIPAGVEDGNQLRLSGEGEGGLLGGPPGDLYVVIHVRPHEIFVRAGRRTSICELPLTFPQAALGDTVEVPVLDGTARADGARRARSRASASCSRARACPTFAGAGRGDAIYEVVVEVPTQPDAAPARAARGVPPRSRRSRPGPRLSKFVERMKQAVRHLMAFWQLTVPSSPDTSDGLTNFLWEQGALGVVEEEIAHGAPRGCAPSSRRPRPPRELLARLTAYSRLAPFARISRSIAAAPRSPRC